MPCTNVYKCGSNNRYTSKGNSEQGNCSLPCEPAEPAQCVFFTHCKYRSKIDTRVKALKNFNTHPEGVVNAWVERPKYQPMPHNAIVRMEKHRGRPGFLLCKRR